MVSGIYIIKTELFPSEWQIVACINSFPYQFKMSPSLYAKFPSFWTSFWTRILFHGSLLLISVPIPYHRTYYNSNTLDRFGVIVHSFPPFWNAAIFSFPEET